MSPEQASGGLATAASDMYAFGLVLQQLFTGHPPFEPGLPFEVLLRKAKWGDTVPVAGVITGAAGPSLSKVYTADASVPRFPSAS